MGNISILYIRQGAKLVGPPTVLFAQETTANDAVAATICSQAILALMSALLIKATTARLMKMMPLFARSVLTNTAPTVPGMCAKLALRTTSGMWITDVKITALPRTNTISHKIKRVERCARSARHQDASSVHATSAKHANRHCTGTKTYLVW